MRQKTYLWACTQTLVKEFIPIKIIFNLSLNIKEHCCEKKIYNKKSIFQQTFGVPSTQMLVKTYSKWAVIILKCLFLISSYFLFMCYKDGTSNQRCYTWDFVFPKC